MTPNPEIAPRRRRRERAGGVVIELVEGEQRIVAVLITAHGEKISPELVALLAKVVTGCRLSDYLAAAWGVTLALAAQGVQFPEARPPTVRVAVVG